MYIGLHAKYRLFLLDFNEIGILWTVFFEMNSNIKFHGHTPNGDRDVPSIWSDDDMTKLIVAFRNFTNAPKTAIKINYETYTKKKQMKRIESR